MNAKLPMNAKLIVALIAGALSTANAYAAQPFGRDSVYATPGTHYSKPSTSSVTTARFGRDSVYATPGASASTASPTQHTQIQYKYGRA